MKMVRTAFYAAPARRAACGLIVAAIALATLCPALAQSWPARPIRLVVPFGPGGPTDVAARLVAQVVQSRTGEVEVTGKRAGTRGRASGGWGVGGGGGGSVGAGKEGGDREPAGRRGRHRDEGRGRRRARWLHPADRHQRHPRRGAGAREESRL